MKSCAVLACLICRASAVLPTGVVSVVGRSLDNGAVTTEYSLLGSQASFGAVPPMGSGVGSDAMSLMVPPAEDELLCGSYAESESSARSAMIVARGGCTFEQKALAAQALGASAIVIHNTLASRYSLNETTGEPIWPQDKFDYDCNFGQATLTDSDMSALSLPYQSYDPTNDSRLSGDTDYSLCVKNDPSFASTCSSQRCLLTGRGNIACCAWDLHVWLYSDPSISHQVAIPAIFITMEQAARLLADLSNNAIHLQVDIHSRPRPSYNLSAMIIWALGVFIAALAAFLSAQDYRDHRKPMHPLPSSSSSAPTNERTYTAHQPSTSNSPPPDSLELTPLHALGFIVMASSALLVLFFLKIYSFVKIMYAFGCSGALTQVFFFPIYTKLFTSTKYKRYMSQVCINTPLCEIGAVSRIEVLSAMSGYALGLAWLILAFTLRHPENNVFFWVVQDIMGACMCILFLSIIKLNSIRVASILLIVAFLYDIFFVFVTPLIFKGQSVMITVATSGGPPKADPSWCEKYPTDADCQGGDPLPMLLTVPRIADYQQGASLLGLGDIVLPGLLLSFAARFDEAKKLVGFMRTGSATPTNRSPHTCPPDSPAGRICGLLCNGGYFVPLVIAYAIGLLCANIAVYVMNMGQPALLYLVPACLGTMVVLGKRRNELDDLWHGPKVIRAADAMVYGEEEFETPNTENTLSEGGGSVGAPLGTVEEGPDGDVPLLSLT